MNPRGVRKTVENPRLLAILAMVGALALYTDTGAIISAILLVALLLYKAWPSNSRD